MVIYAALSRGLSSWPSESHLRHTVFPLASRSSRRSSEEAPGALRGVGGWETDVRQRWRLQLGASGTLSRRFLPACLTSDGHAKGYKQWPQSEASLWFSAFACRLASGSPSAGVAGLTLSVSLSPSGWLGGQLWRPGWGVLSVLRHLAHWRVWKDGGAAEAQSSARCWDGKKRLPLFIYFFLLSLPWTILVQI